MYPFFSPLVYKPTAALPLMKYANTIAKLAEQASLYAALFYDKTVLRMESFGSGKSTLGSINIELYQHALGSPLQFKLQWFVLFFQKSTESKAFRGQREPTNPKPYCYDYNNPTTGHATEKTVYFPTYARNAAETTTTEFVPKIKEERKPIKQIWHRLEPSGTDGSISFLFETQTRTWTLFGSRR